MYSAYGVAAYPSIVIINTAGVVKFTHLGNPGKATLISEIQSLMPTGTLTVTSPNGGQKWIRGTTHTVTWTKAGTTGSYVKIELLKAGVVNRVITSSTANDGSYSWTISSTQTLGTNYKIRITSTAYPSITDSSNNNFSIVT